jgi:AsmA-like protein
MEDMQLAEKQASFGRRYRWIWWTAGALFVLLAATTIVAIMTARRAEPYLRARIVEGLSSHFHARVELDTFHVSLGNGLRGEWGVWAQGHGLRIWPPATVAGVEVPNPAAPGEPSNLPSNEQANEPLISLATFSFHVPLRYKPDMPISVGAIHLAGLHIHLPPKSRFLHVAPAPNSDTGTVKPASPVSAPLNVKFQLSTVECTDASLILETSKPGKLPLELDIASFKLTDISPNNAMHFDAELTNPKPVGTIHTKGNFGPWQVSDPGESPIAGDYRFDYADLGDFKGIAGTLSSTGNYAGTLRDLNVDGQTDTPDFSLTHFGNKMDLKTQFHAIVDGTNGDTRLDPVNATLGRTHITARGQVVRAFAKGDSNPRHSIGHDIDLKIEVNGGRIEDFLHLASHEPTPLLTGDVNLRSSLHIPPGKVPVHERIGLKGNFVLDHAEFSSTKVQDRIGELSLRGQGRSHDAKSPDHETVQANMQSDFQLESGVITLPNLEFAVPGADIALKGTYTLEGGGLAFTGNAKMAATVSRMVGGWKGLLLKPADRFFKKDGAGTEVPIHIAGTYKNPEFGVDVKGMPHTHPQRPDQSPTPPAQPQASAATSQH